MPQFHDDLKLKMDKFVHLIYQITKDFPKHELYGVISQMRRAALSIILNYIEGYARKKLLVQLNFYEISHGSLRESKYLLHFAYKRKYITEEDHNKGFELVEEIAKMLWSEIIKLQKSI